MNILKLVAVFLIVTHISIAQMTGGGANTPSAPSSGKTRSSNPKAWSSLHFGLAQPMGKFKENNLTVPFVEAVGAKPGFYLSYDFINYFSQEAESVKIGVSGTLGMAFNSPNWEGWVQGENVQFTGTPFLTNDFKFGVLGTYEMNDDLKVDGFLRLGINWGVGGGGEWDDTPGATTTFNAEQIALGFGTNLGVNLRFRKLFTTLQLNPGKLKYRYAMNYGDEMEYVVPVNLLKLGMGVNFGSY